jgi:preprotein translocase subunit SecD
LRISVRFEFKETRKAAFEKFTGGHVGRALAVVLDGKVHVCPVIKSAIPGEGQWIGPGNGYTDEEAAEIAALLACGPMPCNLVPEKGK